MLSKMRVTRRSLLIAETTPRSQRFIRVSAGLPPRDTVGDDDGKVYDNTLKVYLPTC